MKKLKILKFLERPDKWYLGGGNRIVWTPSFPIWLDYPGFWDKAHYYNYEIEPVFTWTILDDDGTEVPLRVKKRKWDPSKLLVELRTGGIERGGGIVSQSTKYQRQSTDIRERRDELGAMRISEARCCLPNDVLTSVINIKNNSPKSKKLHIIAWTIQTNNPLADRPVVNDLKIKDDHILFKRRLYRNNAPVLPVYCVLGVSRKMKSYSVNLSEGSVLQPHWQFTPFPEKFNNNGLPNEIKLSGVSGGGLVYIALHVAIEIRAWSGTAFSVFFTAGPDKREAGHNFSVGVKLKDPVKASEINWNNYFKSVPYFHCSDEYITRYYWYRWYGLKLMTINGGEGNYGYPALCEGIGYFRAPISYSAMCHMLENRWMADPKLAQGSLLMFIDNQRGDGGFRGYIDLNYYRYDRIAGRDIEPFYHTNWGNSVRQLYLTHPDKKFLSKAYKGLVRYVRYFDRERDPEKCGMYDVINHYETGQEYMHRYISVDPDADRDNWGRVFRLKGLDATTYLYELKRMLEWAAKTLNRKESEIKEWRRGAEKIKRAILDEMWNPYDEMFYDINPETGKRTKIKAAVCFYPYLTDIVANKHLEGLKKHLFNPKEFWTKYPVPSSSADDQYFSAEAEWKGKRMNCPWNGRVWPMTNSHIAEAVANCAVRYGDKELRIKSVELINKFIRMMFFNSDPRLPNCFEHYNPITGEPSVYRGVDDYQHSWIVDLIIKYVAGVRLDLNRIIIDPFPFDVQNFLIENLDIQGKDIKVRKKGRRIDIWLDQKIYTSAKTGKPVIITL